MWGWLCVRARHRTAPAIGQGGYVAGRVWGGAGVRQGGCRAGWYWAGPAFGGAWGQPFLIGPGTIHVAHTTQERIAKSQLAEAVTIYKQLVERLTR